MNIICEYIKFKLVSKSKHKIHSPFVFDFVTKCLTIKIKKEEFEKIKVLKSKLRNNHNKIEVKDFGAGSKKLSNVRKISEIYKTASSKGIYADLLYQITFYYPIKNVLELGTSLGHGTAHLAIANPNSKIITVDACPNTIKEAKENLSFLGINNVSFIHSTFQECLNTRDSSKFDLIYIDGHHQGKALIQYLSILEPFFHDETFIIIDDIRWNTDMFQAWNKIISDNRFHLTLDLFRMGIVLPRKHQAKEHFKIKLKGILKSML